AGHAAGRRSCRLDRERRIRIEAARARQPQAGQRRRRNDSLRHRRALRLCRCRRRAFDRRPQGRLASGRDRGTVVAPETIEPVRLMSLLPARRDVPWHAACSEATTDRPVLPSSLDPGRSIRENGQRVANLSDCGAQLVDQAMDRRTLLKAVAGAGALAATGKLSVPALAQGAAARTVRFGPQADLANFDPIWGTKYMVRNASAMVWDTLYGMDEKLEPQRQMVEAEEVSSDGLTWTFRLRP